MAVHLDVGNNALRVQYGEGRIVFKVGDCFNVTTTRPAGIQIIHLRGIPEPNQDPFFNGNFPDS